MVCRGREKGGSSVEGSLAMLEIFRCVWWIVELLLQKDGEKELEREKRQGHWGTIEPFFFWWACDGRRCLCFRDVHSLWIRYKNFFGLCQCASVVGNVVSCRSVFESKWIRGRMQSVRVLERSRSQ
jgi:hypothetical protein